ncbi:MAG TPA: cache domain-containing protein [Anaerolineales bacterium]|nr:cache domain-containing protein [Anaerolineales bacterium]
MTTLPKSARFISLTRRFTIGIILLTGIIILGIGIAVGILTYLNEVERQTPYLQAIASQADAEIDGFVTDQQNRLDALGVAALGNPERIVEALQSFAQSGNPVWLELAVFNLDGIVVGSFTQDEVILANLFTAKQSAWFANASSGQRYLSNLYLSPQHKPYAIVAVPLLTPRGTSTGVIAARLDMSAIWTIVSDLMVGENGSVYLVDQNNILIAHRNTSLVLESINIVETDLGAVLSAPDGNIINTVDLDGTSVTASSHEIGQTNWRSIVVLPWQESYGNLAQTLLLLGIIGVVAIALSAAAAPFVGRRLSRPLRRLADTAQALGAGDLSVRAKVVSNDEIGVVGQAFNSMADQISDLVTNLEQRISDRTRAVQASVEVSRRLSTILDPRQLTRAVVEQIQQAFNYYHVHIYLFNDARTDLVLAWGSGDAGRAMLAREHKIPAGRGVVGRSAATNAPLLIADVSKDPGWLFNPMLPETKTELAVPIAIGDNVLGVLDVQDNHIGAFSEDDVSLLRSLADQTAVAVQNARAYIDVQRVAEREGIISSIGQQIQSAASVEEVLEIALSELGRSLRVRRADVTLGYQTFVANDQEPQEIQQ